MAISLIYRSTSNQDNRIESVFMHLILEGHYYDVQFISEHPGATGYSGSIIDHKDDKVFYFKEMQFENQELLDLYMQSPLNIVNNCNNLKNDPEVIEFIAEHGFVINDVITEMSAPKTGIALI